MIVRRSVVFSGILLACLTHNLVKADPLFPTKPVVLAVPYAAGGPLDQMARELSNFLTKEWKQPVVVENRPGGAAQVAVSMVRQAPADGHMIFFGDVPSLSTNPGLFPKLSYDPKRDLIPVTQLVEAPGLFVVPNDSPFNKLEDLINYARANPDKHLNYASQGVGTGGQLFSVMLSKKLGVPMTHVPYRGSAPGLADVMSGQVDFFYDTVPSASKYVTTGKMRALAVGAEQRSHVLPEVPTLAELGYQDITPTFWWGVAVKAGTPDHLVQKINEGIHKGLRDASVSEKFTQQGMLIKPSTPKDFAKYTQDQANTWIPVMNEAGMKAE